MGVFQSVNYCLECNATLSRKPEQAPGACVDVTGSSNTQYGMVDQQGKVTASPHI